MLILLETSHELGIAAITTGCESGRQISVQNGMIERNAGLPPERRIEFRVGIHLGDLQWIDCRPTEDAAGARSSSQNENLKAFVADIADLRSPPCFVSGCSFS